MNDNFNKIKISVTKLLKTVPENVALVAAAKTRTAEEVKAAVESGVQILGYNYVQEAETMYKIIGSQVKWHMIGHLQKNKAKKAVQIFDMIETLDNVVLAQVLEKCCLEMNKIMPVLIEINSAKEQNKSGVLPEKAKELIYQISKLSYLKVKGLMTMGPFLANTEQIRPFFKLTKTLFNEIKDDNIPNVDMQYLSMGMSDSYKVAIEEGANIIRIGTKLFGGRVKRL